MRHCNSVFCAEDIWFLLDEQEKIKRKLYVANCPICLKRMVLYSYFNKQTNEYFEKYYYSGGADRIKEKFKKEIVSTSLGFKDKLKSPSGFKYGENVEVKNKGKVVAIKQYACDFYGNKVLVKKIDL